MFDIPVIAYHKVSNKKEFGLTTISPEKFRNQIEYLLSSGYSPVTFKFLNDKNVKIPKKPILITFDDGYECIFQNAFPILKSYNIKAVVFVLSNYIGKLNSWETFSVQRKERHLSREQIFKLLEYGMEVGSHGKNHFLLNQISRKKAEIECVDSKRKLEEEFNINICSFCYPYGRYNKQIKKIVEQSGYTFATGGLKFFHTTNHDNFSIQRRSIYSNDTISVFDSKLNPPTFNYSFLSEYIIQRGSIPGMIVRKLRNNF